MLSHVLQTPLDYLKIQIQNSKEKRKKDPKEIHSKQYHNFPEIKVAYSSSVMVTTKHHIFIEDKNSLKKPLFSRAFNNTSNIMKLQTRRRIGRDISIRSFCSEHQQSFGREIRHAALSRMLQMDYEVSRSWLLCYASYAWFSSSCIFLFLVESSPERYCLWRSTTK